MCSLTPENEHAVLFLAVTIIVGSVVFLVSFAALVLGMVSL